jgi:hypothetical protein
MTNQCRPGVDWLHAAIFEALVAHSSDTAVALYIFFARVTFLSESATFCGAWSQTQAFRASDSE